MITYLIMLISSEYTMKPTDSTFNAICIPFYGLRMTGGEHNSLQFFTIPNNSLQSQLIKCVLMFFDR